MIDDIILWGYQALAAAGVFVAVFSLLRLRRENRDLRDRLDACERREAVRRDAASTRPEVGGTSVKSPADANEGTS